MNDVVVQPVLDVTIVNEDSSTTVYTRDENLVVIEGKNDNIVVYENNAPAIIEIAGIQGPQGPGGGIGTAHRDLSFIGSGTGSTKTTTAFNGNVIYEDFSVNDEVYLYFSFPPEMDRTQPIIFKGVWFPTTTEGPGYTSSWEIHTTVHDHSESSNITDVVTVSDLPVSETAFLPIEGGISIDPVTNSFSTSDDMHIRLKRVASTNEFPNGIGISILWLEFTTNGLAGIQGPPGEEVPYDRLVDFIDDDHAYVGECDPGGDEAAAVWRIKYVIFATDGDISSKWANGTSDFDKIWNNRASYTY